MTKKILPTTLVLLTVFALSTPARGADVDFGVRGGVYTDTEEPFVGAELLFPLGGSWFLNPNVEYVFIDRGDFLTFNLDAHYDFWSNGTFGAWAGGGLAVLYTDRDLPRRNNQDDTDVGVNLLVGAGSLQGALRPYVQGKVTLADESELVLAVGLRF